MGDGERGTGVWEECTAVIRRWNTSALEGLVGYVGGFARASKRAREIGWQVMHTKTGPLYDLVKKIYKYTPNVSISFS